MTGIVDFIRARYNEREQTAQAEVSFYARVYGDEFKVEYQWARLTKHPSGGTGVSYTVGAPSPTEVIADLDAKRLILDEHNDPISDGRTLRAGGPRIVCGTCHQFGNREEWQPWPCTTLRLLAQPHAGHPDYREEWRP